MEVRKDCEYYPWACDPEKDNKVTCQGCPAYQPKEEPVPGWQRLMDERPDLFVAAEGRFWE